MKRVNEDCVRGFAEHKPLGGHLILDECIGGHLYLSLEDGAGEKINFIVDVKDRKELSKQVKRYRK